MQKGTVLHVREVVERADGEVEHLIARFHPILGRWPPPAPPTSCSSHVGHRSPTYTRSGPVSKLPARPEPPPAVILNAAPVQGSLVDQALAAIAGYEVEMVPVVLHHRIAHVHAFTDGLAAPELTRDSQAGTELTAVFRWVQKKERSLNG